MACALIGGDKKEELDTEMKDLNPSTHSTLYRSLFEEYSETELFE